MAGEMRTQALGKKIHFRASDESAQAASGFLYEQLAPSAAQGVSLTGRTCAVSMKSSSAPESLTADHGVAIALTHQRWCLCMY